MTICLIAPGVVRAQLGDACEVADNGTGTVTLPPEGCGYLSPQEVHMIIDGLPPDTAPRTPGDPVQSFVTEMVNLQGNLVGDPDFADLTIVAGSANGLPSPGHTLLEDLGDGTFNVDSFFDITYQIDFVGAPGGALEGLSGSTQATVRMESRTDRDDAAERDNGKGTVTLPPPGSQYVSPEELHMMIDGLPPGTTIEIDPSHHFSSASLCRAARPAVPWAVMPRGLALP